MADEWTKPGAPTAVSVEFTVMIPASGQVSGIVGRALAVVYDAAGTVVHKQGVSDATLRAVLTATQESQLASIMTTLHAEAVARLVT